MATLKREPAAEMVEQLKAKHGQIYLLRVGPDAIAVRGVTRPEFKRFVADRDDKKLGHAAALENLVRTVAVWPEAGELEQMLDRRPALALNYGDQVLELAGGEKADEKKEL